MAVVYGADANCGISLDALATAQVRRDFFIGYLRNDGWEKPAPPSTLMLDGQQSRLGWTLTRDFVLAARDRGIKVGAVFQNGHAEEIWAVTDSYALGRARAAQAAALIEPIAGRVVDLIAAADRPTTDDGRRRTLPNGRTVQTFPVDPALDYLRGWNDELGVAKVASYGDRYLTYRAAQAGLCKAGRWQSWLLDFVYDGVPVVVQPDATLLQYANADRDGTLNRFGVPFGVDPVPPEYSYVGHDRSVNGATLDDLPVWYPI